ncbi:ras gtpase activating protein [Echinococcus multilocularis]|uniref:Ras gtpase activating protein n=1 Tax=Echinococcus multilocularis TaxID=6211 RepID=A0A068Y3K6_ECHMU|nr:ras gtpase activating protein [Echinococcus multilocularis]
MPILSSVAQKGAKLWKGEELEKRRVLSQQISLDDKTEVSNQSGLVTATSQPSVYLSAHAVKGTWPTVENIIRAQSITHATEETVTRDPEFVKRRATTLDIDMSTPQRQGKTGSRRRLFSLFSKQGNETRDKATLRVKQDCPPTANLSNDTAAINVVQNLVDSLGRQKSELKFSVTSLHNSIVQQNEKNCFEVSTFFPPVKSSTRSINGLEDHRQERVTSLTRRWAQERYRSINSMDEDDDDDDASGVCLRRPAPERRRLSKQASEDSQAPHSVHRIYTCRSVEEKNYWLNKFQCVANPNLCFEKRIESNLHLCLQEIKGVPAGNEYFCEIYLDGALYARTPTKIMVDSLTWSEDFEFSHLPPFSDIRVLLWMFMPCLAVEKMKNRRVSLPRTGVVNDAERSSTYRISIPNHSYSLASMESEVSLSAETSGGVDDLRSRKRRRSIGSSNKKIPADLLLIAKFIIHSTDITGLVDSEAWYTSSLDASLKRRSYAESTLHAVSMAAATTPSSTSFNGASHRPANIKRNSQSGLRLSRKALAQVTRTPPRLRLTARLEKLTVLPVCGYSSLLRALSSPTACTLLLRRLEPWLSVKSKAALAKSLLAMLQLRSEVPAFLAALVLSEVQEQDNPNMVLRSNSLATKAIELYLKQVGGAYLKATLSEFVTYVLLQTSVEMPVSVKEKRNSLSRLQTSTRRPSADDMSAANYRTGVDFEVDPDKVTNSRQLLRNQANLLRLVRDVWRRIQATVSAFPNELRITFSAIREAMMPTSGSCDGLKSSQTENGVLFEHVISACVFLRFVCPAILSPSLFGLAESFTEDTRAVRAFTLVAKTILNLANFTLFGDVKELHMDFLNRFVAEEMPTMRALLWRLSEPSLQHNDSVGSTSIVSALHVAQLVDVLTVLKHPAAEVVSGAASVSLGPTSASTFCSQCSSIMLESNCHRPISRTDFTKASAAVSTAHMTSATPSDSHGELLRRQWLTELQDIQSDVYVCHQAIFGIPRQLTSTGHSLELEQLNLASSLAHCHAQLQAAFGIIPLDKLDQPLKGLRAILASVTHLTIIDTKEWHTRDAEQPSSQQSICLELASSVSALSLAKSTPPDDEHSTGSRCEKAEGNGVGALKPETPVFTAKAKSAQLVEQKTALHRHHLPGHFHIKQHKDSSQTLPSTLNTSSEPGPLYTSETVVQPPDKCIFQTTTNSRLTATTNESSWSLLHATMPIPSPSAHPNTTSTFYFDNSCTSMTSPSPPSSSGSGGNGRPSNHPIMGTSLYSAGSSAAIQRSCTFPNSPQEPCTGTPRPLQPSYSPSYTSGRTLVSVETQTSREQVTELDEAVGEVVDVVKRNQRPVERRHLYINILDEFEGGNIKLSS